MKAIFKLFAAAFVFVAMSANIASADIKFGVAAEPYPPFTWKGADGNWQGWEIEIGNAICAAMNETCEWVEVSWDGIIPALLAKKFDVIIGSMSITEERKKTIAFSDKYYNTPAVIVAEKNSSISGSTDSVKGKIIGVQVSTIHENYANKHLKSAADKIKIYQTFDEHNQDLVSGRIDAVIADSLAIQAFLDSDEGKGFEIKGTLNDEEVFGIGVGGGIRKSDTALREKFNAAIAKIRGDGTYDAISKNYFSFDIYGGN